MATQSAPDNEHTHSQSGEEWLAHTYNHDHEESNVNTNESTNENWDEWESHTQSESTIKEIDHQNVVMEFDAEDGQDQDLNNDTYKDNRRRGYY